MVEWQQMTTTSVKVYLCERRPYSLGRLGAVFHLLQRSMSHTAIVTLLFIIATMSISCSSWMWRGVNRDTDYSSVLGLQREGCLNYSAAVSLGKA